MTDYYELLGVSKDADDGAIKKAYRKLAMKHHPDRNKGNPESADVFKTISEAYATLTDPEKRSVYDKYGEDGVQQMEGGGRPVDPSDIFQQMFGGGGGGLFGGRRQPRHKKVSRTKATVDLKTFVRGGTIKVQFTEAVAKNLTTGKTCVEYEMCTKCDGSCVVTHTRMVGPGMFQQAKGKCDACEGRGFQLKQGVQDDCIWMDEVKEFEEHLPAGHDLSEPLVLFEKGGVYIDPHTKQIKRCDLHVHVRCNTKESDEWQLYSQQHRHLQWTPTLQVVYGMITDRLKCVHPDGTEYILQMPKKNRTETFVATRLGLPATDDGRTPAGDLIVKVLWDFDTSNIAKMPWLVQMKAGLHQRAPWTDEHSPVAHYKCLTTKEYEQYQQEEHTNQSNHHQSQHGFAGEGVHTQECTQS